MATLLEMVSDITEMLSLTAPAAVISSTDGNVKQIVRLLHRAGYELMKDHSWSVLRNQRSFTSIAAQAQTGEPPAAFDRFVSEARLWNVDNERWLTGVVDNDTWLRLTVDNMTGIDEYWSMQQGVINILPAPSAGVAYRYAYVSKNWIRPTGQTTNANDKEKFTVDTDFPVIPSELLVLSVVWRFKQAKGFDYGEDMMTYERRKEKAIGDDRGPHVIHTSRAFRSGTPDNFLPWTIT